jgi:hypothetical protein
LRILLLDRRCCLLCGLSGFYHFACFLIFSHVLRIVCIPGYLRSQAVPRKLFYIAFISLFLLTTCKKGVQKYNNPLVNPIFF